VPETPQYDNLLTAIQNAGDGTVAGTLCSFVPRTFMLGATLTVDPALDADAVVVSAKQALQAAFGFDARDFMQPVYRSEVIATLQNVRGVIALTLDTFRYNDGLTIELSSDSDYLPANPPRIVNGALVGAANSAITLTTRRVRKLGCSGFAGEFCSSAGGVLSGSGRRRHVAPLLGR